MRRPTTLRWGIAALLALLLAGGGPALAAPPVDFGSGYLVDQAGVLGSADEARIESALAELVERGGPIVLVALIDRFEAPDDRDDWLADTFAVNRLGEFNVLLAIAVEARGYGVYVDRLSPLSDAELSAAEEAMLSALHGNRWAEAPVAFAEALGAANGAPVEPTPAPTAPPSTTPGAGGESGVPGWLWALIFAVPPVGLLILALRSRRRAAGTARSPEGLSQKQLDQRVGTLLVQLDDALKTSEQEVGFAEAQFGAKATAEFVEVLRSARAKMRQAFELKQQLDDAIPDPPEQRRSWSIEIIALAEAAAAELEAQDQSFEQLRRLEGEVEGVLAESENRVAGLHSPVVGLAPALTALANRYAPAALTTVQGNPAQATTLLAYAGEQLAAARASLAAGDRPAAALATRGAQQAIGQIEQLAEAITRLEADLAAAAAGLPAAIGELEAGVAEARALAEGGSLDAGAAGAIAAAGAAAETARTAGAADPVNALSRVEQQLAALAPALQQGRTAAEQRKQLKASLDRALIAAESRVRSADEYITTRRGGVGATARTRLSEAQRHLALAGSLAGGDPEQALREAQSAANLAETAVRLADADLSGYGGMSGGGSPDLGAVLGGILGGMLGSGGGSSRGRSSGGWGGGYGGWGGGSGSGSSRGGFGGGRPSGGFGGGRPSGGRSSGGGRARGGRF